MMIGVDTYAATKKSLVGTDWLDLASGALKKAGGMVPGQAAAKKDAQPQKTPTDDSGSTWKKVGVGALVVIGVFLGWRWLKK